MDNFSSLLPPTFKNQVQQWIIEDVPSFDFGAFVVGDTKEEMTLLVKSNLVLAGVPFVNVICEEFGISIEWKIQEGTHIVYDGKPILAALVTGKASSLLQAERIILNTLHRCSGIATLSRQYADIAKEHHWKGLIAGTRKTTPGFRLVEKYGLLVGGCAQHRYDVSAMCMLKDNHIDSCGGIAKAVQKAKKVCGFTVMIEVECRSLEDAIEAAKEGAHIVMLDNFTPEKAKETAKIFKSQFPHVTVEVSGGIHLKTCASYFSEYIDVLSVGGLTQGVPSVDISLKVKK
jgi:nicotinate-nucleotide pyrophosphorylase (carboxylating)